MADPVDARLPDLTEELLDFLRIPSISTDPAHADAVAAAGRWLVDRMRRAGLTASLETTAGHPIALGRHDAGPGAPTVLVYGHYDVQPPEPLEPWSSPPFEPEVRDGRIWGRGAADDKAQVLVQVAAAEVALTTSGLPVSLVLLFEGEEEVGSPSLGPWLSDHADALAADHVLIADSMMFAPGRPSLIFGMRGIAYFEIEASIGSTDLHSGQYGGAVPNPANALAAVIASMHREGRVAVDGFYDDVVMPPASLLEEWRTLGFDEEAFQASAGGARPAGEPGFATPERLWVRPSLDVNGLVSGYTGPGKKTVLPARALAKLSARLVPEQDPVRIEAVLRDHVARMAPAGVAFEVRSLQHNRPWRDDPDAPLFRAAAAALESGFGAAPVRVAHGGTLPIAPELRDVLGAPVAVMGFALPGANMHAPNEWFPVAHLERGIRTMTRLYHELAEGP
ncbi:MAG: dipeptidase [Gemmatimonadetes bacterium]|nr:dipeptidase [Gemmatimonadota bacterium]NIQ55140.1 dipeptidase [Gemmatimonadota bacterium]NIU75342.1 dipeptidase [Gammaproteobacteria bacterium]NIX45114.1 dipeptidase [Gemmatimonadota bacterium]NIY09365.1 dipeptidase [Gemmatimonadota bacterium]